MSTTPESEAQSETLNFQAEVSRLLDLVANALYSHREIFLRELVSNAADACDRLRYAALTDDSLLSADPDLHVDLVRDEAARRLIVIDNGIGMSREELVSNLGTIARSGTASFLQQLESDRKKDVSLIGQFGVGFYSAFMVAERVRVDSRKAGSDEAWAWESDGKGAFSIAPSDDAPARGTRVTLWLKEDAKEYLQAAELRRIVKTYSDHIAVPIRLQEADGGEPLNEAGALWMKPKAEVSEEQYKEFYHHVAHAWDDPWLTLHFRVEGVLEYAGLLFVPSQRPFDLFDPRRKGGVKLYVRRVFITDDCEGLVPPWLRFLRGVVDSEDLPLNVSREMLQKNAAIGRMRKGLTNRVLGELESRAGSADGGYDTFWETFGPVLKEGLYEDPEHRDQLLKLVRFRSTSHDGWVGLADYVGRMKEGQTAIYTLAGDDPEALKKSPQLEGFMAKGIEVLLLTDPVDQFWTATVGTYEGKPFRSVTQSGDDLETISGGPEDQPEEAVPEGQLATCVAFLKSALGDAVKDVRVSARLTSTPVCLVADKNDIDLHLARLLRQHEKLAAESPRILEINPRHPVVKAIADRLQQPDGAAQPQLTDSAFLLLDLARVLEGEGPRDPALFAQRLSQLMVDRGG